MHARAMAEGRVQCLAARCCRLEPVALRSDRRGGSALRGLRRLGLSASAERLAMIQHVTFTRYDMIPSSRGDWTHRGEFRSRSNASAGGPSKRRIGLQLFATICKTGLAERRRDRLRHGTLLSRRLWRAHRRTLTASDGHKVDLRFQRIAEAGSGLKTQMGQRGTGVDSQALAEMRDGMGHLSHHSRRYSPAMTSANALRLSLRSHRARPPSLRV